MYVVHGGWSEPEWWPCTNGRMVSLPRLCNNPEPARLGKDCVGDRVLVKPCADRLRSDRDMDYDGYGDLVWIRSVEAGGNVFELDLEGFSICDTDGTEGLTFDEINACRVNYNFTRYVDT